MLVALRIFGKKELSQLNTADVILILLISNAVQNAMVGPNVSLFGGIVAATVLFTLNFIIKKFVFRSSLIRELIQDKPYILVHKGIVEWKTLQKLEISEEELIEAIREHGVESTNQVKLAMLEIDGNISVISGSDSLKQTHHKRKIHKTLGNLNA